MHRCLSHCSYAVNSISMVYEIIVICTQYHTHINKCIQQKRLSICLLFRLFFPISEFLKWKRNSWIGNNSNHSKIYEQRKQQICSHIMRFEYQHICNMHHLSTEWHSCGKIEIESECVWCDKFTRASFIYYSRRTASVVWAIGIENIFPPSTVTMNLLHDE